METLKTLYDKFNSDENKKVRYTIVFSFILCICLIVGAIYVFRNANRVPFYQSPRKVYRRPIITQKPLNKSPETRGHYLIRRKPGYTEQSPKKKTYPTRFKVSSLLS